MDFPYDSYGSALRRQQREAEPAFHSNASPVAFPTSACRGYEEQLAGEQTARLPPISTWSLPTSPVRRVQDDSMLKSRRPSAHPRSHSLAPRAVWSQEEVEALKQTTKVKSEPTLRKKADRRCDCCGDQASRLGPRGKNTLCTKCGLSYLRRHKSLKLTSKTDAEFRAGIASFLSVRTAYIDFQRAKANADEVAQQSERAAPIATEEYHVQAPVSSPTLREAYIQHVNMATSRMPSLPRIDTGRRYTVSYPTFQTTPFSYEQEYMGSPLNSPACSVYSVYSSNSMRGSDTSSSDLSRFRCHSEASNSSSAWSTSASSQRSASPFPPSFSNNEQPLFSSFRRSNTLSLPTPPPQWQ